MPSYLCVDKLQRQHVLENLDKLVVKPANESGGYGMLIGPQASRKELAEFRRRIKADPRNYMAQPLISSPPYPFWEIEWSSPAMDLRPFVLQGEESYVTPGGLTRVAMVKGILRGEFLAGRRQQDTWVVENA